MSASEQARADVIRIEFTLAEARALALAAGEVMDHGDIAEQAFPSGSQRAAARRAYAKIRAAAFRAVSGLR